MQGSGASRLQEALSRLRESALAAFMKAYPFIHMAQEGATFSYQLAYLLQSSPYFSPTLHVLGQHVVRTSAQELVSFARGPCSLQHHSIAEGASGAGESVEISPFP